MQLLRWKSPLWLALVLSIGCAGRTGGSGDDSAGGDSGSSGGNGGSGGGGNRAGNGGAPAKGSDPGTVAIHRLNGTEYNNTVRDLLGVTSRPADTFTFVDKFGYGFDNNANALDISDIQLESYTSAAEKLANEVLNTPALKSKVFSCDAASGDACVKTIIQGLARRAYRRPVTDAEVSALAGLVKVAKDNGDTADIGIGLAIQAMLTSPNFLYRIELDPDPNSTTPHPISSHEMASRLSYFLWATMPDADLFSAADGDKLKSPNDVKAQVDRMLKDGKASALIDTFGALWTPTRIFSDHEVDKTAFPKFTDELRTAMIGETNAMLRDLFNGSIGFNQMLSTNFTYVNDILADHYGLPKPGSTTLKKVMLTDSNHRAGLLTQASFLAATSQPAITSVVKRGRYVFERMMCGTVSDPPKDVNAVLNPAKGNTVREQFEAHENEPRCAGCHKLIDPPGFVLEQYDAVGAYRTTDKGANIKAEVTFETDDGTKTFKDAIELSKYISESNGFARCVSDDLYAFALGRGPATTDGGGDMDDAVRANLQSTLKSSSWKFTDLLYAIVASDPFRMRRANKGAQ